MTWVRRYWKIVIGAIAAVAAFVVAAALGGRRRRHPAVTAPARPTLTDVEVPDVNTSPADDYHRAKSDNGMTRNRDSVVDELNRRRK